MTHDRHEDGFVEPLLAHTVLIRDRRPTAVGTKVPKTG